MTDLRADTESLGELADLIDRVGGGAQNGKLYVEQNTGLKGGEGLFNELSGAHESALGQLRAWLDGLDDPVCAGAADAVRGAAAYYASTDHASAAALDRTLQDYDASTDALGFEIPPDPLGFTRADFTDAAYPDHHYVEPPDYSGEYAYRPEWWQSLSVGAAPRHSIMVATDLLTRVGLMDRYWDPYETMLKPVVGDWAGFRACADVFAGVAGALTAMADNLGKARVQLPHAWHGNAADGCSVHVRSLAAAVAGGEAPLDALSGKYTRAADEAKTFGELMGTFLDTLVECAVAIVLAASAGAASSGTVIGPIIGGGVVAYEGYVFVRTVLDVIAAYDEFDAYMGGVKAAVTDFGQINVSDFHLPTLPKAGDEGSAMPDLGGGS